MKPKGNVYESRKSKLSGELRVALTKREKQIFKHVRLVGAILASLSMTSLFFFYSPLLLMDLSFVGGVSQPEEVVVQKPEPESVQTPTPAIVEEFNISIPAISAESNVVKNIDPFNDLVYLEALKEGVAHAKDTGLPGEGRRIYLFAHSTNSPLAFTELNAVFYQLRRLENGNKISIAYNGEEYVYEVSEKHIIPASDTSWLKDQGDGEDLVLQTCDPPGTTLRRLLVIARPV